MSTPAGIAHQTHFLCYDFEKATIARYVHHRGTWDVRHLRTVQVEPPEAMDKVAELHEAGDMERFRLRGEIK